jgi:hypothetical protein
MQEKSEVSTRAPCRRAKSEMEKRHEEQSENFGLQIAAVLTDVTGDNAGQRRVWCSWAS